MADASFSNICLIFSSINILKLIECQSYQKILTKRPEFVLSVSPVYKYGLIPDLPGRNNRDRDNE
jgi:hypothetical protein